MCNETINTQQKKDYEQDYLIPNPTITYYVYRTLLYIIKIYLPPK